MSGETPEPLERMEIFSINKRHKNSKPFAYCGAFRGRIKPQMRADIIAVPENPLENILTLREINFVMKEGKVYKSYQ